MENNEIRGRDREILVRFKNGKKVEADELQVIEPYSTIGIVKFGFSFKKKEIQASLTESGKCLLGLDECRA